MSKINTEDARDSRKLLCAARKTICLLKLHRMFNGYSRDHEIALLDRLVKLVVHKKKVITALREYEEGI